MKIVAKSIEMIAWTDLKGKINPVRFKIIKNDENSSVVKIDQVITRTKERLAGNEMIVFACQSLVDNIIKIYEINTCKWILFKV